MDPVTQRPLSMDRLEDEASIMFIAGAPGVACPFAPPAVARELPAILLVLCCMAVLIIPQ